MKFAKCVLLCLTVVLSGVLGPVGPVSASEDERDGLIIYYFSRGYNYRLIVCFLFLYPRNMYITEAVKKDTEVLGTTEEASTFGQGSV